MCGRYVRRSDKQRIAEHFRAHGAGTELPMPDADYNVTPTTHQPIIRQSKENGERELILARWGLVPFFTKDLKSVKGLSTISARAETLVTASMWREPFKKRRCLVSASAFYEWPKEGKAPKQPYALKGTSKGDPHRHEWNGADESAETTRSSPLEPMQKIGGPGTWEDILRRKQNWIFPRDAISDI